MTDYEETFWLVFIAFALPAAHWWGQLLEEGRVGLLRSFRR